jgi:CheY-like chemotaxis protein
VPRRILLVDDDIAQISAVKRVLLRAGHRVTLATNSTDALAAIEEAAPDLVVLAPACENGDGAALGRQLASQDATRGIPIIVLGAGGIDGVAAVIVQHPTDPGALESALRAAWEHPPQARPAAAPSSHSLAVRAAAGVAVVQAEGTAPDAPAPNPTWTPAEKLEDRRHLHELEVAQLERAAAEQQAILELRRASGEGRETEATRQVEEDTARRSAEGREHQQAAEEAARRRVVATARERSRPVEESLWLLSQGGAPTALPVGRGGASPGDSRPVEESLWLPSQGGAPTALPVGRGGASPGDSRPVEESLWLPSQGGAPTALPVGRGGASPGDSAPSGPPESAPRAAEALAPELLEGSLATISMPRLLALAAQGRATGRLEVAGDAVRTLWVEGGRVVGAATSAPTERTEEIALRLGLITRDQHRQVLPSIPGLASRRVGVLLLDRGFLKPTELALLARRRAEEIAFALFTCDGRYRFEPGEVVPADERLALERGTFALAIEGIRRRWQSPRLEAALGGPATLLEPAAQVPPTNDLALSAEEKRVWELADGLRTLDEILAGSPLDPLSSRQVLAGLVELGLLQVRIKGPPEASALPRPGSIDLVRIDEKLEQVRRADYFVILGLGRTCTGYEIREASERLLSELNVERFDLPAPDLAGKLEEIQRVLEEARDILSDDGLRAEYLASLGD